MRLPPPRSRAPPPQLPQPTPRGDRTAHDDDLAHGLDERIRHLNLLRTRAVLLSGLFVPLHSETCLSIRRISSYNPRNCPLHYTAGSILLPASCKTGVKINHISEDCI